MARGARRQINPQNFIRKIAALGELFESPMAAIHAFYTFLPHWDVDAVVPEPRQSEPTRLWVTAGDRSTSEAVELDPARHEQLRQFVESHHVLTDHATATIDHYFSRIDEVLAWYDPDYSRNHGIFFTDSDLSRFALWFAGSERYAEHIVIDPAAGSGNLVSRWRGEPSHKLVSELQPDLLRILELRVRQEARGGGTVVARAPAGGGLNFLSLSAEQYLRIVERALTEQELELDRPLAFLLNPPFKTTDMPAELLRGSAADYPLDPQIVALTGRDAQKERYAAFLAQIMRISDLQAEASSGTLRPILLVFTPTSWLIPKPSYLDFRREFDRRFEFVDGFIVTSSEFFALSGRFPVAFTVWQYSRSSGPRRNRVELLDLTGLERADLSRDWTALTASAARIELGRERPSIKSWVGQSMFDFKRDRRVDERGSATAGGLPRADPRRRNKKTYGESSGDCIGFMDDGTPVRVRSRPDDPRFGKPSGQVLWFRIDSSFADVNKARCVGGGPPDQKGYAAYDLESARRICTWFGIAKAVNGRYPVWANQLEIWAPELDSRSLRDIESLCFSLCLAESRAVVTRFPKGDPVAGAALLRVRNPLCPIDPESFWSTVLAPALVRRPKLAWQLAEAVRSLYAHWKVQYCGGQARADPHWGLVQIAGHARVEGLTDLEHELAAIRELAAKVRDELFDLLETSAYFT